MLERGYKKYCLVESFIAGLGFFTIVILTLLNAILRQFNMPIIFVDDMNLLLFGWVAFLGADVAFRHCRLVGMDMLTTKLPIKVQKTLQIIVYVIMIATFCMFARYGTQLALTNWPRDYNTLPISYGWATLSLPVCSVLMMLTAVIKIFKTLHHFKDDGYRLKDNIEDPVTEPVQDSFSEMMEAVAEEEEADYGLTEPEADGLTEGEQAELIEPDLH